MVLTLTGCGGVEDRDPPVTSSRVLPLRVTEGTLEPRLLLTGELVAEKAVEIYAPDVSVRPLEIRWLAEDGAEVRAGDPLVELDTGSILAQLEDLRLAQEQAEQKLAVTEAQVAAEILRAELALSAAEAKVEGARIDASVPSDLQPETEYEEHRLALHKAELDLGSARADIATKRGVGRADTDLGHLELERAREELHRAEEDVERMTVRAPEDGVLLLGLNDGEGRRWQVGDQVWPGLALARLPDARSLRVEARLSDVDDGRLAAGMKAVVVPDALPDLRLEARVRSVEGVAQIRGAGSASRAFRVILELADRGPEGGETAALRPGMSVRAEVRLPAGDPLPLVPRSSLVLAGGQVRVVLAGGEERVVELAGCDLWSCAVRRGVEPGEAFGRRSGEGS